MWFGLRLPDSVRQKTLWIVRNGFCAAVVILAVQVNLSSLAKVIISLKYFYISHVKTTSSIVCYYCDFITNWCIIWKCKGNYKQYYPLNVSLSLAYLIFFKCKCRFICTSMIIMYVFFQIHHFWLVCCIKSQNNRLMFVAVMWQNMNKFTTLKDAVYLRCAYLGCN